jgi:hypothetical protein
MEMGALRKHRWFWPWQDDQEEAWLESMAAEGWRLSSVGLFGVYQFYTAEPERVVYRLDYMPTKNMKEFGEYQQMFIDAGWTYVGEMSNWRYWCKAMLPGVAEEIFTDRESKVRKYRRVFIYLAFIFLLLLVLGNSLFFNPAGAGARYAGMGIFIRAIQLIYLVLYALYIYIFVRLGLRILELKRR